MADLDFTVHIAQLGDDYETVDLRYWTYKEIEKEFGIGALLVGFEDSELTELAEELKLFDGKTITEELMDFIKYCINHNDLNDDLNVYSNYAHAVGEYDYKTVIKCANETFLGVFENSGDAGHHYIKEFEEELPSWVNMFFDYDRFADEYLDLNCFDNYYFLRD